MSDTFFGENYPPSIKLGELTVKNLIVGETIVWPITPSISVSVTSTPSISPSITPSITPSIQVGICDDPSLRAFWKMDETTGLMMDQTGTYNLAQVNTPTYIDGVIDSAIQFNGTSSYLSGGTSVGALELSDFSVSFWVNVTGDTTANGVMGCWNTEPYWYINIDNTNRVWFRFGWSSGVNTVIYSDVGGLSDNTWYHVVCTADRSGDIKMYVNGTVQTDVKSIATYSSTSIAVNSANNFNVGNIGSQQSSYWGNLSVDDVGIWTKVLSQTEVNNLYNSNNGLSCGDLPISLMSLISPIATENDGSAGTYVNFGLTFYSTESGYITKLKYYKTASNTADIVLMLYRMSDSVQLGLLTISGNTTAGWVEAEFNEPIPINADTNYIAIASIQKPDSYFHFYFQDSVFTGKDVRNYPLIAPASGTTVNGYKVYNNTYDYTNVQATIPTRNYNGRNWFVDVEFYREYVAPPSFPTDCLLSYYPLEEASGTIYDDYGSVNFTPYNSPEFQQPGKIGYGISFSGVTGGQYPGASCGSSYAGLNPNGDEYSISCWVYLNSLPTTWGQDFYVYRGALTSSPWYNIQLLVSSSSNRAVLTINGVSDSYRSVSSSAVLTTNVWYHLVGVVNGIGNPLRIYVNTVYTNSATNQAGNIYDANSQYTIGSPYGGSVESFKGVIDEIAIFNCALTTSQVGILYGNGNGLQYSPTASPSVTPSISITPTITPSITSSVSITPSRTPSISVSSTPGAPSPSVTPSISSSISSSVTPSISVSRTRTPSVTPSRTPSMSVSSSPGVSITPTPSVTPSISISRTRTPSVTPSVTTSISISRTRTPSVTPSVTTSISISRTRTPSVTPSVTPSISISRTRTPSVTPSISRSRTPSVSITPTPSRTKSVTPSPSQTDFRYLADAYNCDGYNCDYYIGTSYISNYSQLTIGKYYCMSGTVWYISNTTTNSPEYYLTLPPYAEYSNCTEACLNCF